MAELTLSDLFGRNGGQIQGISAQDQRRMLAVMGKTRLSAIIEMGEGGFARTLAAFTGDFAVSNPVLVSAVIWRAINRLIAGSRGNTVILGGNTGVQIGDSNNQNINVFD